jgi:hypothetical protein
METSKNTKSSYGSITPYIDIIWRKGHFFMSNSVLKHIGNPPAIQLLWNSEKCSLIIKPTDLDNLDCYPVMGKKYAKTGSLFMGSVTLVLSIWASVGWNKTMRYRIIGKYNEISNVLVFDMKDAVAFELPKKPTQ